MAGGGGAGAGVSARCTLQTLCEQIVVMGWKASSWQQTHMKICSILRRKFFETDADRKKKMHHSWKNKPDRMIQSFFFFIDAQRLPRSLLLRECLRTSKMEAP